MMEAPVSPAVPYFSQWETPDMTASVLSEGAASALLRDPLWQSSGASDVEEYARWAGNLCGMACLKMVLAARTGRAEPTVRLGLQCRDYGGYVEDPQGAIKGLIYAPFIPFVRDRFGLDARVVTGIAATEIAGMLDGAQFFLASVHHSIRWPEREPPAKGGHLVLVTAACSGKIRFHNPSGHDGPARENVELPVEAFDRFFAGRGIAIV